jgi:hypothetical protein
MPREVRERIEDVKRLVAAARTVAERRAALVPAIVESTGLTPEGVELAFARSLEVDATDAEIATLVERAGDAPRVAVVLSSNVFVGALRALAVARAAAPIVVVRPSRRDPTVARALVETAADRALTLDEAFDVASWPDGEVHVYGRDETIADVRARVRGHGGDARVIVRGHGAGMGVAWISRAADPRRAAAALAEDVVLFDQRGCLSPRVVLVEAEEGDATRADAFADALHADLERLETSVPRGVVPGGERAAADRYVATMTYACRALVGRAHAIGVGPRGAPVVLPPPYRHVHVAPCASAAEAKRLLEPLAKAIVAVGTDDAAGARALSPPWARVSALGRMQRPPLDGPVDQRDSGGA